MTNKNFDLGENDSTEDVGFPPVERKLVTQPYDLSIQTLIEQWESELLIVPEIQREYVWDNGKASRLIESLLLNIPIPIIYLAETEDARYEVIDGHQRIKSVARYMQNQFALSGLHVLPDYKNLRYAQLPSREQRFLKMRTLRAVVISQESHPSMKFEVFERLNLGAITLNAQELRNSIYRGEFNRLLKNLARDEEFRYLLGSKTPRKRMVDEELVLRFFALKRSFDEYRPPLKKFLNEFMDKNRNSSENSLYAFEASFRDAIDKVKRYLGRGAFRVCDSYGEPVERAVNRALFDAQMLSFSWVKDEVADVRSIRRAISGLYSDETFMDSTRRATGDRTRTRTRVRMMVQALEAEGMVMDVPFDL